LDLGSFGGLGFGLEDALLDAGVLGRGDDIVAKQGVDVRE